MRCTHWLNSGYSSGWKSTLIPRFAGTQPASLSADRYTPPVLIATSIEPSARGTIVWIAAPPAPGIHSGRCGCSHSAVFSSKWRPPSTDRHSECGSQPAHTTSASRGSGVRFQIRSTAASASSGKAMAPDAGSDHVAPSSSLVRTDGPQNQLRAPASSRGGFAVAARHPRDAAELRHVACIGWLTVQPSSSPDAVHRPLRVPIAIRIDARLGSPRATRGRGSAWVSTGS